MQKITSVEMQREFGRIRMEAHKDAVIITNHGRDDLALISAEEYRRLKALDQQAFYVEELPDHIINGFGSESLSPEAQKFDNEYK